MTTFDWVAAVIVAASFIYVGMVLTVGGWLTALRKGQAVTLLPAVGGRPLPLWTQLAYVFVGLILFVVLLVFGWIPFCRPDAHLKMILGVIGLILYVAGIAFVLWARRTLGRFWGLSTSRQVKLLDDHQLIQSGPYALVRNPMYFGWYVASLGLLLLYSVWALLLLFLFSVIAFLGRAHREEIALSERFGEVWVQYKKHTKFLIPFIY